jgi:hypothetical protein
MLLLLLLLLLLTSLPCRRGTPSSLRCRVARRPQSCFLLLLLLLLLCVGLKQLGQP